MHCNQYGTFSNEYSLQLELQVAKFYQEVEVQEYIKQIGENKIVRTKKNYLDVNEWSLKPSK